MTTTLPRFGNVYPQDMTKRIQDLERIANANGSVNLSALSAQVTSLTASIAGLAPLASPAFSGAVSFTGATGGVDFTGVTVTGLTGIGGLSPNVANTVTTRTSLDLYNGSLANPGALFAVRSARGTSGAPAALHAGDELGIYGFGGQYDTTATHFLNGMAAMKAFADEAFTATTGGTHLEWFVTPTGSVTPASTARLDTSQFLLSVPLKAPYFGSAVTTEWEHLAGVTIPQGSLDRWRTAPAPARTQLASSITSGATSATVVNASQFPTVGDFIIKIDDEQIHVTSVSGATWTILRSANGTSSAAHAAGAYVRTSGVKVIVGIGDSLVAGAGASGAIGDHEDGYIDQVRRVIAPTLGDGFRGLWLSNEYTITGFTKVTSGGALDLGPFGDVYEGTGSTNVITWVPRYDAIVAQVDIIYEVGPTGFGDGSYSTDGGSSWTTIPTSAPSFNLLKRMSVVVANPADFRVRAANAAGTSGHFVLVGLVSWSTVIDFDTVGTVMHNIGKAGSKLSDFCRTNASGDNFRLLIGDGPSFRPSLAIVEFSNDVGDNTVSAWATNVGTMMTALQGFACDALWVSVPEQDRSASLASPPTIPNYQTIQAAYRASTKTLSTTYGYAVLDMYDAWSAKIGAPALYATTNASPWFLWAAAPNGTVHPSQAGYNDMSARVLRILTHDGGLIGGTGGSASTANPSTSTFTSNVLITTTGFSHLNVARNAGSAVTSGQALGSVVFQGAADSLNTLYSAAAVAALADENFATTGTHGGGRLVFQTSADGSNSPTTRGGIDAAGKWYVGLTTAARWVELDGSGVFPILSLTKDQGAAVGSGNAIGSIQFRGSGDASDTILTGANIQSFAEEAFATTGSHAGSRLTFGTSAIGSATPTTRGGYDSSGKMFVGTPTVRLFEMDPSGTFSVLNMATDAGAALLSGAALASVTFQGAADASNTHYVGARIAAFADENFATSGTHAGTRLVFSTSGIGSSTPTVRGGIDSAGKLFVGLTTARWAEIDPSGTFPILSLSKDQGSAIGSGNAMASIQFRGAGDASDTLLTGASIQAFADENFATSGTHAGSRLAFGTSAIGSSTPTIRGGIDSAGKWFVGLSTARWVEMDPSGSSPVVRLNANTGAAVVSGGTLATLSFQGAADASNTLYTGAQIVALADENFATSGTHAGTRLAFYGSGIGSNTPTERGGIDSAGKFYLGVNTARWYELDPSGVFPVLSLSKDQGGAVGSGNAIGSIQFRGAGDASDTLLAGASIQAFADEGFATSGTHAGTRLILSTSAIGSSTPTARAGVDSAGIWFWGTNAARVATMSGAGVFTITPSTVQAVVAATTISPNSSIIHITSVAAITLTATPTITAGSSGQLLTIVNDNTFAARTITFQSNDTLATSALSLSAATLAIGPGGSITFAWSAAHSKWVQTGVNAGNHI